MAGTSDATASRNTSKKSPRKVSQESEKATRKTKDDLDATRKLLIFEDLNSIGIKLDLSKATKRLNRLLELTYDRKTWRSSVEHVVHY